MLPTGGQTPLSRHSGAPVPSLLLFAAFAADRIIIRVKLLRDEGLSAHRAFGGNLFVVAALAKWERLPCGRIRFHGFAAGQAFGACGVRGKGLSAR